MPIYNKLIDVLIHPPQNKGKDEAYDTNRNLSGKRSNIHKTRFDDPKMVTTEC